MRILPAVLLSTLALFGLAPCGLSLCSVAHAQSLNVANAANAAAFPNAVRAHAVTGAVSEGDWLRAEPLTSFVQREPAEGVPATYQTEARVIADGSTLHVIVKAQDPNPEKIVGYLTRRDEDSQSDWIHIFIDSYHDRRTGYQFAVNAAGVKRDAYWFNDDNDDDSWDAVWDVKVDR